MTWALLAATGRLPIARSVVEISYRDPRVPAPSGMRRLSNTHHRVLEVVAEFCEKATGRHCFYSVEQIGERVGIGERWARQCLRDLEKFELEGVGPVLETLRGGGRLGRDPKTGRMKGRASVYRVPTAVLQILDSYGGRVRSYGVRPAPLTEQLTGSGRTPLHLNLRGPAGPPNTGRSTDVRRAPASARDGMRIASPAGSARDDLLSSRASLGPGNGGVEEAPTPGRKPAVDYRRWDYTRWEPGDPCPICGRMVEGAYKEHVCPVSRRKPSPTSSESPQLPLLSEAELKAEHERLLALERARMEAST